jgi:ribosomal protein S27E
MRTHKDYDYEYQAWLEREEAKEQDDYLNGGIDWADAGCPDCDNQAFSFSNLHCPDCGRTYEFNPIDGFLEIKTR